MWTGKARCCIYGSNPSGSVKKGNSLTRYERLSHTLLRGISQLNIVLKKPVDASSNCMGCDVAGIQADVSACMYRKLLQYSEMPYYGFICCLRNVNGNMRKYDLLNVMLQQ